MIVASDKTDTAQSTGNARLMFSLQTKNEIAKGSRLRNVLICNGSIAPTPDVLPSLESPLFDAANG